MTFNSINSPVYLINICSTQKNGRANNYNDGEKRREEYILTTWQVAEEQSQVTLLSKPFLSSDDSSQFPF